MVEAAIVMPVLITCFGAMMYAGGTRYTKLEQQQLARDGVLTYATNACKGGGISGGGGTGLPSIRSQDGNADPNNAAQSGDGATDSTISGATSKTIDKLDKSFGTASGGPPTVNKSLTAAKGQISWAHGGIAPSTAVTGHSFFFCNEEGNGAFDFFGYAKNLIGMFLP